jgi:hypothetical protein
METTASQRVRAAKDHLRDVIFTNEFCPIIDPQGDIHRAWITFIELDCAAAPHGSVSRRLRGVCLLGAGTENVGRERRPCCHTHDGNRFAARYINHCR